MKPKEVQLRPRFHFQLYTPNIYPGSFLRLPVELNSTSSCFLLCLATRPPPVVTYQVRDTERDNVDFLRVCCSYDRTFQSKADVKTVICFAKIKLNRGHIVGHLASEDDRWASSACVFPISFVS